MPNHDNTHSEMLDTKHFNILDVLFDRMPMAVAVLDLKLCLIRYNPTWVEYVERYTDSKASKVQHGVYFFDVVAGGEAALKPLLEAALRGETVRRDGVRLECAGIVSYWDQVYSPLIQDDKIVGVVDVSIDATERVLAYQTLEHRVEERTREIESRQRVAEGLRDILGVLNSQRSIDEILDFIMDQACRLLGTDTGAIYKLDAMQGMLTIQAWRGLTDEYVRRVNIPMGQGVVGRAVEARAPVVIDDMAEYFSDTDILFDNERRKGQLAQLARRYGAILAVPLIVKNTVYGGITLYYPRPRRFSAEDVALARTFGDQAALALENARLRSQAQEAAVAAERSRLARDLHDSVTQTLFSASLIAEVLPRLWDRNQDEGRKRLDELRQLARGALAEMRMLLLELRPSALVEAELADLLRQLVEAVAGRARVPVRLLVEGKEHKHFTLPTDVKIACYRIAQEALNNIAKHARASQAEVNLRYEEKALLLRISDNGHGFDPSKVQPEHLGLGIMKERAESAGAYLQLDSSPDRGTVITLRWVETEPLEVP